MTLFPDGRSGRRADKHYYSTHSGAEFGLFGGSEDVDSNTLRDYDGTLSAEIVPPLHSAIMLYQEPT